MVTLNAKNEVQAFKVIVGKDPLFTTIKGDDRARIKDTAVSAEALLPGGPYDLWRGEETSRWVKDLVGAFAESARLPKMLNRKDILDTIVAGCRDGLLVLRLMRPDHSIRTFWREQPDDTALKEPSLEAVLPEAATLTSIAPDLLAPGALPGLWDTPEITVRHIVTYFSGNQVVTIPREGYEEAMAIPHAEAGVVEQAIRTAVKEGTLWLTAGQASIWLTAGQASIYKEDIPSALLSNDVVLQAPPQAVSALDAVHQTLPEAQPGATTTAQAVADALSARAGKPVPWSIVRDAISSALRAQYLELAAGAAWPYDATAAQSVILQVPLPKTPGPEKPPMFIYEPSGTGTLFGAKPGMLTAQANLGPIELHELAEQTSTILREAGGLDVTFRVTIELSGRSQPRPDVVARINAVLEGISNDLRLE